MNALQILSSVLGVLGLAGGSVAYFAKNRGDSIITYQSKEIELRDGTIARLEKDNSALTREVETLRESNDVLKQLAQGSPELSKLVKVVKTLSDRVTKHINR